MIMTLGKTLGDVPTDIAVMEARLMFDAGAELGSLLTFQITAINRGGVWERA